MRLTSTDLLAQAIGDPGSITPRRNDETVTRWSARAAEIALKDERSFGDMYERAYFGITGLLDSALGTEEENGAGQGLVADVALLAQRYADLKAAVLDDTDWPQLWSEKIGEIESAGLREPAAATR